MSVTYFLWGGNIMIKNVNKIFVISVIFISLFNFNTKAQDTNQTISEIEEILVTAQRRAENIEDFTLLRSHKDSWKC